MSTETKEKMISHAVLIPKSLNLDLSDIATARKRKQDICDCTKPQLICEFSGKGVAVHKLLEAKEFNDKEILTKIRKIYSNQ